MNKYIILFFLLLGNLVGSGQQQYRVELSKIQNEEKLLNAHVLMLQNKFPAAIEILEKLLLENPKEGVFAYELSKVYLEGEDNLEKATKFIEKAVELEPKNTWYLAHAAFLYSTAKSFDKELEVNRRLIELEPHYVEHYMRTSNNYALNNDFKNAIKTLDEYEDRNGKSEWTVLEKHQLYNQSGDTEKAIDELEEWINNHPKNIKYLMILADYQLQNAKKKAALENYKKVLEIDKNHKIANQHLFTHGLNTEINSSLSQEWFASTEIDINTKIGKLLSEIKTLKSPEQIDEKQLISFAQTVSQVHPNEAKSFAILADLHSLRGNLKEALVNYQKSLKLDQNHFLVWESALSLSDETGNDKVLLKLSDDCLLLFPEKFQSYWYYGLANYKATQYSEAISILQEAQIISNGKEEIWTRITGLLAICTSLKKNDLNLGLRIIDKGLSKFPNNSELEQNRLYLNARFGKKVDFSNSTKSTTVALANAYDLFNNKKDQELIELNNQFERLGTPYNEFLIMLMKSHQRQNNSQKAKEVVSLLKGRGAIILN